MVALVLMVVMLVVMVITVIMVLIVIMYFYDGRAGHVGLVCHGGHSCYISDHNGHDGLGIVKSSSRTW